MKKNREEERIHHHRGNPPFSFSGSEASVVYALLSGPIVYTLFHYFPQANGIHHALFAR